MALYRDALFPFLKTSLKYVACCHLLFSLTLDKTISYNYPLIMTLVCHLTVVDIGLSGLFMENTFTSLHKDGCIHWR